MIQHGELRDLVYNLQWVNLKKVIQTYLQDLRTIERFTVTNNEIIREIPIVNKIDSLGDGSFSFNDSTKFADGNSRTISGIIPFTSAFYKKKDSTQVDLNKDGLYTKIKPGDVNFILEQKMKLKVGLFEDPKTKKVTIAATTSYPGVSFSQLDGADIMSDDISRKAARNLRKTWGIGVTLGYGAGVDLKTNQVFFGPQLGIGLHYTPKWLQWGK